MKIIITVLLLLLRMSSAGETATLHIRISGADTVDGVVSIALFNSAATFLKDAYRSIEVPLAPDRSAIDTFT